MPNSDFQTLFELSGPGLPPYSARGLTETFGPIQQSVQLKRTINGLMRDYSLPQFHLYAISISGNDQRPPFAYRPGTQVVVRRAGLLGYKTSGGAPERPVVAGSEFTEKDWTYYRAELMMLVTGWSMNFDEWAAGMDWSMSFEELGGA